MAEETPVSHPIPELGDNVSRYNPYEGQDRGLSILNPELGDGLLYRVKEASWQSFGFDTAPGYLTFKLESFTTFPDDGTQIEGPGIGGSFDCATRTLCDNPVMIEMFALDIYQKWYKGGGRLMTLEEIEGYRLLGQKGVVVLGKDCKLTMCESTLDFASPDGIHPIRPSKATITYRAFFPKRAVNPGDPTEEQREYTFEVAPEQYRPLTNVREHYKSILKG